MAFRTLQRWEKSPQEADQRKEPLISPKQLSEEEKNLILETVNSKEYRDLAVPQIVPKLADEGRYIGSESTIYRVMRKENLLTHRRKSAFPKRKEAQRAVAKRSNEIWSWDITYMRGPVLGSWALERRHLEVVKYLIEKGAEIHSKDEYGSTALMLASEGGHLEMVKYLIEKGADIHSKHKYGRTALMYASEGGHLEVVKYLIEKGAEMHSEDKYGTTALMLASGKGHLEVVKYLIEKGAEMHSEDEYGRTALMYASEGGHLEVVKYLQSLKK